MPPPSTAEDLLARVAGHDERALGALYDLMAPGLLGLAQQILPNRKESGEVVDGAFAKLVKEASGLHREGASVAAWLTLSTRAAAVERRRARQELPGRRRASSPFKSYGWLPRPQEIQLLDERRELLEKVMRQLPGHQIEVLELAVFEGCTEAEIGQRLAEPLGQVRAELRAALRFLRHRVRAVLGEWAANI